MFRQLRREGFEDIERDRARFAGVHVPHVFAGPAEGFAGHGLEAVDVDLKVLVEIDVPLGESSERYLLQVLRDGQIIREVELTAPNWIYATDLRAGDSGGGTLSIQVSQLSERYGAGPFQRIEINE